MKHCLVMIMLLSGAYTSFCQSKVPAIDQSPMDISYYPSTYPILKIQDKVSEPPVARVIYSRPQRSGRTVFGELVEYEKVWRLGANEATEIEFFSNVVFGGKPVPKGRYTLYCIPSLNNWIVIINKELNTWGSFIYDSKKDLVRVEVPVKKLNDPVEAFSLYFEKTTAGFEMIAAWENTSASVPISSSSKPVIKASKIAKR